MSLFKLSWAWALALPLAGGEGEEKPRTVEEVVEASKAAVVLISSTDRRGEARGTGSGFLLSPDGVVATAFHVIGHGRRFTVELADGTQRKPLEVLAWDREADLALLRIEGKDLPDLELGDSDGLRPGQTVVAVGNPLGFKLSVSQGVVAAKRESAGRALIQVSMPIEPGSSGSPLLDLHGKVVGVLAMRRADGLGFAVPAKDLRRLLERKRPVPLERWLTVGALDPRIWNTVRGGDWRQRAGRIVASGSGEGFGGRMLCLSRAPPPEVFEAAVEVKLEDEGGAAGLAFRSDGGERHYGFYPTRGALRLARFEGPDVFHWTILRTVRSDSYRPGEWNALKVRVEGKRIACWVNGAEAIRLEDEATIPHGLAGLVKFREPGAEFRRFRVGPELPSQEVPEETARKAREIAGRLDASRAVDPSAQEALAGLGQGGVQVLLEKARGLEKEARMLRSFAGEGHRRSVEAELRKVLSPAEEEIDLLRAALLLSRLDNPELEVEPYAELVERLAGDLRGKLPAGAGPEERLEALKRFLFEELGFHGSGEEYYHRSNSYLNEVLDDREGIPLTLSLIFLELARRTGLEARGVGLPGHFLVEWRPPGKEPELLDVFGGGRRVSRAEAEVLADRPLSDQDLRPVTKREIVQRMLRNLLGAAEREGDREGMLHYLDAILALDEKSAADRFRRSLLRYEAGRLEEAAADLDRLLEEEGLPEAERERLRELRESLRRGE